MQIGKRAENPTLQHQEENMPDEDGDTTHHTADGIPPLTKRQKPIPQRPKSPDPTDKELFQAHRLSQAAAVESPEELARRLGRLHEGLQGLDETSEPDDDPPPAS